MAKSVHLNWSIFTVIIYVICWASAKQLLKLSSRQGATSTTSSKRLEVTPKPTFPMVISSVPIDIIPQYQKPVTCEVVLDFSNIGLTIIKSNFISNPHVIQLNLRKNNITRLHVGAFSELPNLRDLDLSYNKLKSENFTSFGGHSNLETLKLDNNLNQTRGNGHKVAITSNFPNLKCLFLRNVQMKKLSANWNIYLPKLRYLYLSYNMIDTSNLSKNLPTTVTHLHLEHCHLKHLETREFKNVTSFSLDDNDFKSVKSSNCDNATSLCLSDSENLKELSISNCNIMHIDNDALKSVPHLSSLNISNNKFTELRTEIFDSVPSLRVLNLSMNSLSAVPNFDKLPNLAMLIMDRMKNVSLSSWKILPNLPNLKHLSMRNNYLQTISTGFLDNLPALEELHLSGNQLHSLPNFVLTTKLRLLNLNNNLFDNFASLSLDKISSLEILELKNNPIKHFQPNLVKHLPQNLSIYL